MGTGPVGAEFASDTNRLWNMDNISEYIYEIGTTNGTPIGSFSVVGSYPFGLTISTDKKRIWTSHANPVGGRYITEIGTTNGIAVGSFISPNIAPRGLTFASDKNRLWHIDVTLGYNAIYEIGTTNGNVIGSFVTPSPINGGAAGLTFASDKNRLWLQDQDNDYIYEIGTTNGNIIGSFASPTGDDWGIALSHDKKRLWLGDDILFYFYEIGTLERYSHIKKGGIDGDALADNIVGYEKLTTGLQGTYMPKSGGTFTGSVDYSGDGKPPRLAILTPGGAIAPITRGATGTVVHTSNLSYYEQRFNPGTANAIYWEFQIPEYYDAGTLDFNIWWKGYPTTGTVVWEVSTLGRTINETFNNALAVLGSKCTNTQGSAKVTKSTITGKPDFVAGELAAIRLKRIGYNTKDTLVGSASLLMAGIDFKAIK